MEEFRALLETFDTLLGPNGCPWDRKQTLRSLRGDLLEEVHEVLESIALDNNKKIQEELGDVFACLVLLSKVGEKEKRFTLQEVLKGITSKLIRRHPHVFADATVETDEEMHQQWERIKAQERGETEKRTSIFDGIPPTLPALARSQELARTLSRHQLKAELDKPATAEEEIGSQLWKLVEQAAVKGVDAEEALRTILSRKEALARENEGAVSNELAS